MAKNTAPYASAMCEPSFVAYMRSEGDANGYVTPENTLLGFTLINNQLVSESFIQQVLDDIGGGVFDYRCNYKITDIFSSEFLDSLEADERELLMPAVLQLIVRGDFPLCIWTDSQEEEATACAA